MVHFYTGYIEVGHSPPYNIMNSWYHCVSYSTRKLSHKDWKTTSVQELMKTKMMMTPLYQCSLNSARFAMIKRLIVFSYHVVMPEHVRNVLQGSRTLASLVLTVGNLCPQPICRSNVYM